MKVYKVRNKETGKFSNGKGSRPGWTNKGKTWNNMAHLKAHLIYNDPSTRRGNIYWKEKGFYDNAEIVEVEYTFDDAFCYDINLVFDEMHESAEKRDREFKENMKRWEREKELKQLAELKRKYENV